MCFSTYTWLGIHAHTAIMRQPRRLGIECPDHHLLLVAVSNHEASTVEHDAHGIDDSVEAACCTALLGESNDAERILLAVLDDCHHLGSK